MKPQEIIMLVAGCLLAVLLVVLVVLGVKLKKADERLKKVKVRETEADAVKVVDGVRYSEDVAIAEDGAINVSHLEGDVVLQCGKVYRATKGGELLPGVYTLLSGAGSEGAFKLRVGGLVRNFRHGDEVVLGEGEEICAVSSTVVLR